MTSQDSRKTSFERLRLTWETYGVSNSVLPADACVQFDGLQARPQLNGQSGNLRGWDAKSGRFIVGLPMTNEILSVRPSNLITKDLADYSCWICCTSPFGSLPSDVILKIAIYLQVRTVAAMSAASRASRAAVWMGAEAESLWSWLLKRDLGAGAETVVRSIWPEAAGPHAWRTARGLKRTFKKKVLIVPGGVDTQSGGSEVVACPVIRSLRNVGVGAQGAVRRAAGDELEAAITELSRSLQHPLPFESVTLLPGGNLAKQVALVVTEIPDSLREELMHQAPTPRAQLGCMLRFLDCIHDTLLSKIRECGHRSLAMPTLCTGGIGLPPHIVALSALRAVHRDFCMHPTDTLEVRVCCFENEHKQIFQQVCDEVIDYFYMPDERDELLISAMLSDRDSQ